MPLHGMLLYAIIGLKVCINTPTLLNYVNVYAIVLINIAYNYYNLLSFAKVWTSRVPQTCQSEQQRVNRRGPFSNCTLQGLSYTSQKMISMEK